MSDFESRLTDALASGAEGAPGASGLAEGARRRSRRRRRTTAIVAAAAAAIVAVPVGVLTLGGGGSDGVDEANEPPSGTAAGQRVETWHDVQVEVPTSWGYGSRTAWCIGGAGDPDAPLVQRPGVTEDIACFPTYSHGVSFGPNAAATFEHPSGHIERLESGDSFSPGTWLGTWYDADTVVEVAAGDKATVQQVLDSVQVVGSVDGNGCPVTDSRDVGDADDDEVTVCRYSAEGDLEQSERLTGEDAEDARDAVTSAPEDEGGDDCANGETEYAVLTVGRERAEVQYAGGACSDRGLFVGGTVRELTEDVMYWALSPGWSGGVEGWVPLPDQLRQLSSEPQAPPPSLCPEGKFANSDFALDADNGKPMTVCRMELTRDGESGGTYLLADETELSVEESAAVRAAVEAAPVLAESDFEPCSTGPGEFFLVRAGDKVPLWVYNGECGELTVLTAEDRKTVVYHEVSPALLDALGSPYGLLR